MPGKALVLDANILIRAVLGQRVRRVLESHADATVAHHDVEFLAIG